MFYVRKMGIMLHKFLYFIMQNNSLWQPYGR